jgi:Protein kinase domain
MDFGIAKMTTSSRLTATGQTMGTVRYMSPEQVRGQEVDPTTDLYSLGATIFESILGETPFDGETHFEIMSKHLTDAPVPPSKRGVQIPHALEEGLLRLLAKKPADRFPSAREVRKLFEAVLRENDVGFSETQRVSRPSRPALSSETPVANGARAAKVPKASELSSVSRSTPGAATAAESPPARSTTSAPTARRWGWWLVGLAALIIGGAVTGTILVTRYRNEEADPPQLWEPEVGHLTQQQRFSDLGLLIRTPVGVAPDAVAASFREAWAAFVSHLREQGMSQAPEMPVRVIAVVPREALCAPSTYSGMAPPDACSSAVHTFRVVDQTLVIVDEPREWQRAMRLGIPEAACAAAKLKSQLCELAMEFVPDVTPAKPGEDAPGERDKK